MIHSARVLGKVCLLLCSLALLSLPALGQVKPAPNTIPLPEIPDALRLSNSTLATLAALEGIEELPAVEWRMHTGDLPHGEAAELDDSGWPEVKGPYVGTTGATWFRRTIVVPATLHGYDLTGATIHFAFDIWGQGPVPVIVYFNGRRVAMGEAMEAISLFENAKPGDKIVVAVKALDSADIKHFRQANLRVDFPQGRPDPRTIRMEALSAMYLIPALLPEPADRAKQAAQQKVLEDAVHAIDLQALEHGEQKAFDQSLQAAQAQLESLRPLLAQAGFHLTGNAHIDAAWVWPWTETVDVVRRTFGTALQLMKEYPAYTYSQSASAYYEWMANKYPYMSHEIGERARQGRWELVGGMWVEPDLNLIDGESIVRQLLVGTRLIKQLYGAPVRVGWNPDTFGYTWQLPQIYKKSGIDYFVTQKMDWNETNQLPLKIFYWQSPDGSRVLTYFAHDYNNPVIPDHLSSDFSVARRENPGLPEMMHLYGIGDHGGGPTRTMLDIADSWMQKDKIFPAVNYGTAESYLSQMKPKLDLEHAPVWNYAKLAASKVKLPEPPAGKISVPVWNDELYLEYTRGVYTTQAQQKRNMRESEEWMLDAEKWSALAWLTGTAYPTTELNEAWKKVLFNQFHDIAGGSGVEMLYKDAQADYDSAHLIADSAQQTALHDLVSYVDTSVKEPGAVPIIVWNSLAWPCTDPAEAEVELPGGAAEIDLVDGEGKVVPSQAVAGAASGARRKVSFLAEDVPALGYKVFYAKPATSGAPGKSSLTVVEQPGSTILENELLKVTINMHDGCMTHLVDKRTGFDSIAKGGCGNQLQTFVDVPADYDAWNIDADALDKMTPLTGVDSAEVFEKGKLRASVRIARSWHNSKFVQEISLTAGLDRIDVANQVDWREEHVLLKAAFPLAASGPMATYEIPYGSIDRPTTRNNSWEAAKFEVPALRWADLGDGQHGFSLLNEAKYGYDAKGNVLRLTLLRSPTSPDPHADLGQHTFSYSLYPHADTWQQAQTLRRGYEFNYLLKAEQPNVHAGRLPGKFSFVSVDEKNLVVTALKKTEDGEGLLVRFYESAGERGMATLHLPPGIASATETNLMEEPQGAPLVTTDRNVSVPFAPFAITTVRVNYRKQGMSMAEVAAR